MRPHYFAAGLCVNACLIALLALIRLPAVSEAEVRTKRSIVLAPVTKRGLQPLKLVRLRVTPPPKHIDLAQTPSIPALPIAPVIVAAQPVVQAAPVPELKPAPRFVETGRFASVSTDFKPTKPAALPVLAGFASAVVETRDASRKVVSAGFDLAAAGRSTAQRTISSTSAFDQVAYAKPPSRPIVREPVPHSVEILSKPKPDYTEEARRSRIEGEVWLEVLFGADGIAEVRRVVRSLGYGLDEMASEAVRKMRFRPAQNSRGAVDEVATIRVLFLLAE